LEELTEAPCAALPKPEYIARQANRLRQKLSPEHPRDLEFELVDECLPNGFLRADLKVKNRRHLLFARREKLNTLAHGKTWYIDGTLNIILSLFATRSSNS